MTIASEGFTERSRVIPKWNEPEISGSFQWRFDYQR
jgi:hypothetical protein